MAQYKYKINYRRTDGRVETLDIDSQVLLCSMVENLVKSNRLIGVSVFTRNSDNDEWRLNV